MIISPKDLIDFDYCPRYYYLGGQKESDFDVLIKSIINITLLRYWAKRIQDGAYTVDVRFLAESVFAEMMITTHPDTLKYLIRMILKSEKFAYDKVILVGAELTTKVHSDVHVKVDVPFIYQKDGETVAIIYNMSPGNLLRDKVPTRTVSNGYIPNLLFLNEDIKIDRVIMLFYRGTHRIEPYPDNVRNNAKRFEYLAEGITCKLSHYRYGPWCHNCPLSKNDRCDILRTV